MRFEDWPTRLFEAVRSHADQPFAWGTYDCLMLPADCVLAMTGVDPAADIRGRYDSEATAYALLAERGCANAGDALALVFPEIAPALAQRGDLGVIDGPTATAGVVFLGTDVVGRHETRGVRRVARGFVTRAFRVE